MAATDAELAARLERGEKVWKPEEMSDEYKEHLQNLMLMQADSELAGAFGYVPWIMKAPSTAEMLAVSTIAKDEIRHARVMYKLLTELGVDVEARVQSYDYTLRVGQDLELGSAAYDSGDKRVNIFYYPINTWFDYVMFNFCMDRGAGHQLEDVRDCSYGPWMRVMEGIFKEEDMHIAHGDAWVERLSKDPKTHDATQEALDRWFPRTMNIFGKANSPKNKIYRRLGLKARDNQEVRDTFANEVYARCDEYGLRHPEWNPDWEKIHEEAVVPG
ncbi:MAG: 1,2-phenylacetyl-CoA epoxidase subunit PaaC [Candidatus Dormibacteria bacterium]